MARPPRLPGFAYRGKYFYFLTFCTSARSPALGRTQVADMVLKQFRRTARRCGFALSAYCLMPDHVHLLVHGQHAAADLRRFVKSAKQSTGQTYARFGTPPLWQESYVDRVVRPEESLIGIARYILENPVRAGLVAAVGDYPYAGSDTWPVDEILPEDE